MKNDTREPRRGLLMQLSTEVPPQDLAGNARTVITRAAPETDDEGGRISTLAETGFPLL